MTKSILEELTEQHRPDITDEQMGSLGAAVQRLTNKQIEIESAEKALAQLKAEERKIGQEEVPELMDNLGFTKIVLSTGETVTVADAVQCGIPAPQREAAYLWLDKHGHGALIKSAVTAKFARGEKDQAYDAVRALEAIGISPSLGESVHAGTLKAWAREELAQGHSLPADLFKIHVVRITKVK